LNVSRPLIRLWRISATQDDGGSEAEPPLHFQPLQMQRIPVAREGWLLIIPAILFTAAALLIQWYVAAIVLGFITALLLHFFRDPAPRHRAGEEDFIAPADGTVIHIGDAAANDDGLTTEISILASMFDVKVNRSPNGGTIADVRKMQGTDPMQTLVVIRGGSGNVGVRQVGGLLARELDVDRKVGQHVARGDRLGMIKSGSRVDLLLPKGAQPTVRVGERVKVGVTTVARLESQH
jgi:phosphatidylserine decarboxylase